MKRLADLYPLARWLLVTAFACFWLAVITLTAGCGGSSPASAAPAPAPAAAPLPWDYRDFAPMRQSVTRHFTGGSYRSDVDGNQVVINWGVTAEHFRVVGSWVCLDAYEDAGQPPHRIRTTLAEISFDAGATWQPVVHPCAGQPYTPLQISGPFTLRVWGYVEHVSFFWQHTLTPMRQIRNTCWTGAPPDTRDVLHQQEVWWSAGNGWLTERGTGHLRDGVPDGTGIQYTAWFQSIARDAGHAWVASFGCLIK